MSKELTIPFEFASFQAPSKYYIRKFDRTSTTGTYSQRQAVPGLFLVGFCKTTDCINNGKPVWSPLGFGSFDIAQKIRTTTCNLCRKNLINVKGAAIYKCLLVVKGEKVQSYRQIDSDNINAEEVFQHEIQEIDSYLIFGSAPQQIVKWYYLKMKSTQPKFCANKHRLGKYKKTYYDTWLCNQCKRKFESSEKAKGCQGCGFYLCWDCL